MSDTRASILVRCPFASYPENDGYLRFEAISNVAYTGPGLYLMVPVQNEAKADELQKRLAVQPNGDA